MSSFSSPFRRQADFESNEDDLTAKLAEIVQHNRILAYIMDSGHGIEQTMVSWNVSLVSFANNAEQLGSSQSVDSTIYQFASTRNVRTRYQANERFCSEIKRKAGSFQRKFVR